MNITVGAPQSHFFWYFIIAIFILLYLKWKKAGALCYTKWLTCLPVTLLSNWIFASNITPASQDQLEQEYVAFLQFHPRKLLSGILGKGGYIMESSWQILDYEFELLDCMQHGTWYFRRVSLTRAQTLKHSSFEMIKYGRGKLHNLQ